jgi:hypothetical protein
MEHRRDLELLLLDGLAEPERQHVVQAIDRTTAQTLQRLKRSERKPWVIDVPARSS